MANKIKNRNRKIEKIVLTEIQRFRNIKINKEMYGHPDAVSDIGFGRLCPPKKHIMLLAVLIFFRNYAKIMLLSENYALYHRNYAI